MFGGKGLEELFFGNHTDIPHTWNDWTYNKLKNPRTYATEHVEQLMPNFHLADADILALRVWLQSRVERIPPAKYRDPENDGRLLRIQQGRRVVEQYNCMGCHQIDGKGGYIRRLYQDNLTSAPPILNLEGSKVQPEWLFGFLEDPSRQPLRFWLKIRMPTFGLDDPQRTKVVDFFGAVAKLKDPYFFWDPSIDSNAQQLAAGKRLMSDEFFSCWSCHVRGTETPGGPPEQWAPNLAYANGRLNPQWVLRWIKNPQALMPGTKMPSFFEAGQPGPDEIFGGDVDQQIAAMRDYIMSLGWHGGVTTQTADKDKDKRDGGGAKPPGDRAAEASVPGQAPPS
jgi:mono/diheme cytochrome c family protein